MEEKQYIPAVPLDVLPSAFGCSVFLSAGGKTFVVNMDDSKFDNIKLALEGVDCGRPTTFEFFRDAVRAMGCRVLRACFYDERDGVFFARVAIELGGGAGRIVEIDSRPSDAIPLAVRCGARIFIDRAVLRRVQDMSETFDKLREKLM